MIRYIFIAIIILTSCNEVKQPDSKGNPKNKIEQVRHKWAVPSNLDGYQLKTKGNFIGQQQKYTRVREAYRKQGPYLAWLLKQEKIKPGSLTLYFQAFKSEGKFLVWAKNKSDKKYKLLKVYSICKKSGKPGPKRKEGDRQVPEGFYHIDRLNPTSKYHLSLHVNYPNPSDLILSDPKSPGGLIFIHGKCATIGCLPMQDGPIEELYVLCTEAMNNGQKTIPVTLFPFVPEFKTLSNAIGKELSSTQHLWNALSEAYTYFDEKRELPQIRFERDGKCNVIH